MTPLRKKCSICGAKNGPCPKRPDGLPDEALRFAGCFLNTVVVPDVPGPKGACLARDTRIPGNLVGARCTYKKGHSGPHQWAKGVK